MTTMTMRLIAQWPAEAEELVEAYGAEPAKVVVIPSAVNVERYVGVADETPLIAYVGRMLPRKDPRNIVRALAILAREYGSDARLLLVGGETREPDPAASPEIGELQRLAAELGVGERLAFTGKRQPDELRWYCAAADVAVTTPWYEPLGLTPLEAMACGAPVIGSAVGGIAFTVADDETGLLVPPRDPAALAARLHEVLTQPEPRERMSRAARDRIEREFTWGTVARRTAALYDFPEQGIPLPDETNLQDPRTVAQTFLFAAQLPPESNVQELIVTPVSETSWP